MVKLTAKDSTSFEAPEQFTGLTNYFKDINEYEGPKEEFVFDNIEKEDLERVLEVAKLTNYKFNEVAKVKSNDARAYLGEDLSKFFAGLSSTLLFNVDKQLNNLFKAAKELRIKGLENNIASYLATKIWIPLTLEEYNKKKQELGITEDLTPEKSKQLKEKYPFLN